jgi:hypothetical protein
MTGLKFPGKYRAVEEGSGIYVGLPTQVVVPKKKKALQLPYGYFASALWVGQPAKPFAEPALRHVAEIFPKEFASDFNKALSRSRSRKASRKR